MEKEKNNYKDLKTDAKIVTEQETKINQDNFLGKKLEKTEEGESKEKKEYDKTSEKKTQIYSQINLEKKKKEQNGNLLTIVPKVKG